MRAAPSGRSIRSADGCVSKRTSAVGAPTSNAAWPAFGKGGRRRTVECRACGRPDKTASCASPNCPGAARRRDGTTEIAAPSLLAAVRLPSRASPSFSACTISARTRPALRKRTSVLAGCTLASTSRGIERDEQRHHGMAVARQIVGIGRAHRAEDELVAHRAAVDEQILPERVGPGQRGRGGKAFDHDALALGAHLDGAGCESPRPGYRRAASAGRARRAAPRPRSPARAPRRPA